MMSPHQKQSLLLHLEHAWQAASEMPTTTPCNACIHFSQGFCRRWNDAIPKETLEMGCGEWEFLSYSCPF